MMRAAIALAASLLSTPTFAQQREPIRELAGSVAVRVIPSTSGAEAALRACMADEDDLERRATFLLNQTRLIVTGFSALSLERHPEYRRLSAAVDAAEARLPAFTDPRFPAADAAAQAARRALQPWLSPPLLQISTLTLIPAPGICAEAITVEVSVSIEPTNVRSSRATTERSLTVFSRTSLISTPASTIRDERARIVERLIRDFANAWAEANR